MSQFGSGPKPPGWGRPPGQAQIPGAFIPGMPTGQFGIPNPMQMMGMPMVNQAAFQQPGMNNMNMNMMAQQAQFNAANAAKMAMQHQQQQPAPAPAAPGPQKNQRTFVGVVTKMHDNYGFVDDDVFFQHSVIRGSMPRVGERVMVEATFNPNMPFKWNAHRVQQLNDSSAPSGPSPTLQMRPTAPAPVAAPSGGSSRWGPQTTAPTRAASPPRRRSPPRRSSPPRRPSPPRRASPRRPSPAARRSSPRRGSSPRRTTPHRESTRKRDRSPASGTPRERSPEKRKDSASPPRRRARIIPRYVFNNPKPIFNGSNLSSLALRKRYNHLYIPSDFVEASIDWTSQIPADAPFDMSASINYHVFHKDVDAIDVPAVEVTDTDPRFMVKVLLLAHPDKVELGKKTWGILPDGGTDDAFEPVSYFKNIQLLVGTRGKEVMGIGGLYSPSLDGPNPLSLPTMIKTAIRTTRQLTGIDLSNVSAWYQLAQVRYFRGDRSRVDRVTLVLPDPAGILPSHSALSSLETSLQQQLLAKVTAIDEAAAREEEEEEKRKEEEAAAAVAAEKKANGEDEKSEGTVAPEGTVGEEKEAPAVKTEVEDVEMESPVKGEKAATPTHWSKIDVKALKVAELKVELELRGMETKGIKTLLAQRLQEAVDKEQSAEEEEAKNAEKTEEKVKEEEKTEEKKKEEPKEKEEKSEGGKSEEEKKKEDEERRKVKEKADKERKEKKAILEKHFLFPKEPRVLVFPSKTAKQGKFECKVVSLASLLDYRQDDNKENQFEVSVFAEALRDVLERTFCFRVYSALVNAADKDVEKKKREEAREPKKESAAEGAEGTVSTDEGEDKEGKEKKKEEEKKEEKKKEEKVELRSVIIHRDTFEAFAFFDQNLCGYVLERDLEEILSAGELSIPRGHIQKLAKKLASSGGKVSYRHLTDSLVDPDGETRYTPGVVEKAVELGELARGYGAHYKMEDVPMETSSSVDATDTSSGLVTLDGVVVNVRQKIEAVKKLEGERDVAVQKIKELETSLKNLKDTKDAVDKKRKRLEEDVDKYQKRLRETEKNLKTTQDELSLSKSGITDMKDLARRLISVADKTLPKKEKKKEEKGGEEKKEEKKENGSSEKGSGKVEEGAEEKAEGEAHELTLSDQIGGDEENGVEEKMEEDSTAA